MRGMSLEKSTLFVVFSFVVGSVNIRKHRLFERQKAWKESEQTCEHRFVFFFLFPKAAKVAGS